MSTISPLHTACKNCVFATYADRTQTGCTIGYLDKYRKNSEILEVYDNDKEFYVINDKKCVSYREPKWFDIMGMSDVSMQEKINKVMSCHTIDYALLVDLKYFDTKDLTKLVNQINVIKCKPKKIIFIRYQNDQKTSHTYENIKKVLDKINSKNITWRIQTMVNNDSYYEILNNTVSINKKNRFFCCLEKPIDNLHSLIDKANHIVYNDLESFLVISNAEKTALLFSGGLYRYSAVVNQENLLKNTSAYIVI